MAVILRSYSHHNIDVEIKDEDARFSWRCTEFYGHLEERLRERSWDLLRLLRQDNRLPWLVVGDFNEISHSFEK